jgi:hypothetical protein
MEAGMLVVRILLMRRPDDWAADLSRPGLESSETMSVRQLG